MNDQEYEKAVDEILSMHKKINRPRPAEYVYDRWWKCLIMLRLTESDPMYGKYMLNFRRAAKQAHRIRRLKHLMGILTSRLPMDEIFNQGHALIGDPVWYHCKIYGREYIYTIFGQIHPAIVLNDCHYVIDYHDEWSMS